MSNENRSALAVVCGNIMRPEFQSQIKQALPPNVTMDRFTRVTLTAIQQNPDVANHDRQSLYNSVVRCAQDGLLPDGREAALVVMAGKVAYFPMVAGLIKRLATAGISIDAQVVREHDTFEQELGDNASITHKTPRLGQPRGDIIGAYAIARLPNGMVMREVMSKEDIDQVRNASRSKNSGPWSQWYGEMARKTVIRRLAKRLPILDASVAETVQADDDQYDFGGQVAAATAADVTPPASTPAAAARPSSLARVVEAGGATIEGHAEPLADPVAATAGAGDEIPL